MLFKRKGDSGHFQKQSILFFLTSSALRRLLPEPNLLGLYQRLTYLGGEKYQIPSHLAILSHLSGEEGYQEALVRFTVKAQAR